MAEFFTGGPFSQGMAIARNLGEIRQSMLLKQQEIDWREKQAPALQAKLSAILEKAQSAGDEADDAEPGSPQEMAAHGRYMVELSRAAPRVMAMLSGLQLSGNPYAAQAGQATAQSFLQMTQATMQGAAQLQTFRAQQQEMDLAEKRDTREGELQRGQLGLQQKQLELTGEEIAGKRDERSLAREEMDFKRSQRPLQEEALRAQIEESKAGAEQRRAEAKQATEGRPATLGEKAQFLAALSDAEAGGFLTPEMGKAAREQLGLPAGVQTLEMWDQNLQKERKGLEAMLERTTDERRKKRIQSRLAEIRKEDEKIMDAQLDADEKRRTGPRWYESILGSMTGDPMGDAVARSRASEPASAARQGASEESSEPASERGNESESDEEKFSREERRLYDEEVARRRRSSGPVVVPAGQY